MIRSYDIGTTTVQGPAHDMPRPFDPATHIQPQERAAEAHDAVSAGADSQDATSPSRACCGEAQAIATWALDQYEDVIRSDYEGTRDFRAMMEEISEKRADLANIASDPVPAARRSPLEHERDAGPVILAVMRAAYLAGFNDSGEGWNGEWPFGDRGLHPEGDDFWCKERDKAIDDLLGIKREGKA